MNKVQRNELLDYVTYTEQRSDIQPAVLAAKTARRIHLGDHLTFLFENCDTVRYQVQEMMRVERIVKEDDILHELATYNELLGDRGQLGCTLLIEIDDQKLRDEKLTKWLSLTEHLYVRLQDGSKARAIFDPRQVGDTRLSSVQYLKFDTGGNVPQAMGCDHPDLSLEASLSDIQKKVLAEDLT